MTGLRVIHYARESDAGSVETGDHMAQWERSALASAAAGEIVIAQVLEQQSGAMIESRRTFHDLLAMARRGEIDAIRIDRPDRLGRGDAQAVLRYAARQAGVVLLWNTPAPDENTTRGMIDALFQQFESGIERIKIRDRFIHGKLARAKAGRVLAVGKLIYGWQAIPELDAKSRRIGTRVEFVTSEINIVRDMARWVLEGMSIRGAVTRLNGMEIPSPRGKAWRPSTVAAILRSTMLKGVWTYNRREMQLVDTPAGQRRKLVRRRDPGEFIEVAVPGIMAAPDWDTLQAAIARNRIEAFRKKPKRDYLVRGMMRCAGCAKSYTALSAVQHITLAGEERVYAYYLRAGDRCAKCGRIKADTVDGAVWAQVVAWLGDDAALDEGLPGVAQPDMSAWDGAIEAARKAERQAEAGLLGVLREKVGKAADDPALPLLADLEAEHARAVRSTRRRREEIEAERARAVAAIEERAALVDLRAELRRRLADGGTPAGRRAVAQALDVSCLYDASSRRLTVASVCGSVTIDL
jgi:hypothetical protein